MTTDLADVLAWVLIHSLWQGLVIAGIVLVLLRTIPARYANTRYLTALTGLLGIVLAMLATGSVLSLDRNRPAEPGDKIVAAPADSHIPSTEPRDSASHDASYTSPASLGGANPVLASAPKPWSHRWADWLLMGWLFGVGVMILRTAAAIVQVRNWRQSALPASQECLAQLEALLQDLYGRVGLRRAVSLIVSDRVTVPSIIGTLWPCILVPSAMLTGLPLDQWRIILAHELAHIRRYDVLVNLVQMLIESVLFFNPAMWWLSHQIRVEREACCDAIAANVCGESLTVARTLVEFAARLDAPATSDETQRIGTPSSVLASFADPTESGTLTDRVHRLIQPDAAAYPKVSWWGLLVVMGSLGLTSLGLGWGTDAVVKTASQLMSPKQRVAELERLQNEASGQYFPPEPKPAPTTAQGETKTGPEPPASVAPKFSVTVTVRTADGSPVPRGMHLISLSQLGNSGGTSTLGDNHRGEAIYRETFKFGTGFVLIAVRCPGYAEAACSVIDLRSGPKSRSVEFVLEQGSTVKLAIRAENGTPISNALVGVGTNFKLGGIGGGWPRDNLRTDEQGTVALANIGSVTYTVKIRASGFQAVEMQREFQPSESVILPLTRGTPVHFNVIDGNSELPLAGARFSTLATQRGSSHRNYGGDPRNPYRGSDVWSEYGQTDATGKLVVDELDADTKYVVCIQAKGYGVSILQDVQVGDPVRTVKIFPSMKLGGRISGNLDLLRERSANSTAKPQRLLKYSASAYEGYLDSSQRAVVDDEGRFEIPDRIMGEKVTFNLPDRDETVVVTKSITDLNWDIGAAGTPPTVRDVIIRLTGTAPDAPARGTLSVWGSHPNPKVRLDAGGSHSLSENQIQVKVPVGMRLSIRAEKLMGYQFENRQVDVAAGGETQLIEIPVRPAGGILTRIVRSDGSPATDGVVKVFATQLPPGIENDISLTPDLDHPASEILASLPLGGRYRILAREFNPDRIAWAISPEITLDQEHPIEKIVLKLHAGRPVPIRVLLPDGKPARGIPVAISVSFRPNSRTMFETSSGRMTDDQGVALFQDVSLQTELSGLKVQLYGEIRSASYCGWKQEVDLQNPPVVHLVAGVKASGVLIEASSGKPIPNAPLRLLPVHYAQAKYFGGPLTKTDHQGRFQFEGLEPIEYYAFHHGLDAAGAISPTGSERRVQGDVPEDTKKLTIRGGEQSIIWKATIAPGSSLKVAD